MKRPVILDLFCGAGGVALGLQQAGFDVVGVDLHPQPRYPGAFLRRDVTQLHPTFVRGFDAAWASPPCQGYTPMRHAPGAKGTAPKLISTTIQLLNAAGVPWALENIESAEVRREMGDNPLRLCGSMFGLGARGAELRRHRLFTASFPLVAPGPCRHGAGPVVGVYGGRTTAERWDGGGHAVAAEAIGMGPGFTMQEMSEAIPPAFAKWVGDQLMQRVRPARAAA